MIKLIGNLGKLGFNGAMAAKSLFVVFTSMIRQFFRSIKTKTHKKKTKVILLSVYCVDAYSRHRLQCRQTTEERHNSFPYCSCGVVQVFRRI